LEEAEMGKVAAGKVGVVGVEKDLVGVVKVETGVVVEVAKGIGHRFSDNWPCGAWNTNCVHWLLTSQTQWGVSTKMLPLH